jgi:hypothetical protein
MRLRSEYEFKYNGNKNTTVIKAYEERIVKIFDELIRIKENLGCINEIYNLSETDSKKSILNNVFGFIDQYYLLLWRDTVLRLTSIFEDRRNDKELRNLNQLRNFLKINIKIFPIKRVENVYTIDNKSQDKITTKLDIKKHIKNLELYVVDNNSLINNICEIRDKNIAHLQSKQSTVTLIYKDIVNIVESLFEKLNFIYAESHYIIHHSNYLSENDFVKVLRILKKHCE